MADNGKKSSSKKTAIIKESGRRLPTTDTKAPMPKVKPPKPANTNTSDKKK